MTHVRGRADGHAGARERLTFDPGRSERDAEVGDDRMPAFEQDVLRLDVPVDHAAAVRVAQGIRHLARDGQGVVQRELLLAVHAGAQGLALHERHHVEEPSARLAGIVQRQDMWMPQVRGGLDLALEALTSQEFRELGAEHLDRDLASMLQVVCAIHRGHAADSQDTVDAVSVVQRAG